MTRWVKSVMSKKRMAVSDSPPIASGLPHCCFGRMEHNSQWYAVYLHRGCMSTLNLFMRRSVVETFDPRRERNEALGRGGKVGLETDFFGEGELMVRKPRAPAMSKEAMRQESERLVREAMARNVTITQGKTRLDVKCSKCGAPNRVSAEVDHGRVEYACKECGHKQKTL
jgi:DNA-directed RNA polymerase subunit RPC12/RpoP